MEEKFKIIAVGSTEFIMGFKLAGVNAIETDTPTPIFEKLLKDQEVGIIVTDDKTINLVDEKVKENALESVKPVTVVLSQDSSGQEALQKMIKKSLGVDLWKD
ncbi:V-type ATP synthase subunit F [Candidatus Woesearchaeota archaeon]|nr:MAG: V-type ATP synthase subunit F [Candidatus Woesearchaeota archaeon]